MRYISQTKAIFSTLVFLLFFNQANTQELLGVTLGNYSGTAGLMLNPAGMTANKTYIDINIATTNIFLHNNYLYIPKEDFVIWDIFKKDYVFPTYGKYNRNVEQYNNQNIKEGTVNVRALGPSFMIQVGDHAFGITTGVRYLMTGANIPWDIAEFGYNGIEHIPLHNIEFDDDNFDFNTSAWMEIGISYAYDVYKSYDQQLTAGISVKKLWGYAGAFAEINNVNYVVVDKTTINIINLNSEVGFSLPLDYDSTSFFMTSPTFRGSGAGIDIGAVFIKKKNVAINKWNRRRLCAQSYEDYIYRIGISILDIGRVKYSLNSQLHSFDDVSKYWENVDTINYTNINNLMMQLSETLYGDPDASLKSKTMKIGLPTAISLQVDFNFNNNLYLGGMWIHPIRLNMHTLKRPAQLAIVPRYETQYFEVSIPVSLYEYQYPRIGIAARLYFFTIGTERLGTYLGLTDMNGLDIYASIKIGINKGSCKSKFGGACSNQDFGSKLKRR